MFPPFVPGGGEAGEFLGVRFFSRFSLAVVPSSGVVLRQLFKGGDVGSTGSAIISGLFVFNVNH